MPNTVPATAPGLPSPRRPVAAVLAFLNRPAVHCAAEAISLLVFLGGLAGLLASLPT